jgi:glucose/arabinose dehydrogenase
MNLRRTHRVADRGGRFVICSNRQRSSSRPCACAGAVASIPVKGSRINNHWTRNIIARPDGQKLYVSVGSASNVGEYGMDEEIRRANILEINRDGSGEKVLASGPRNPNGMDWQPETGALWTA